MVAKEHTARLMKENMQPNTLQGSADGQGYDARDLNSMQTSQA